MTIHEDVVSKLADMLFVGNEDGLKAVLEHAVQHSAIVTHRFGTRRYGDLVFELNGDEVIDVNYFSLKKRLCYRCFNLGFTTMTDEDGGVQSIPCEHQF